MPVEVEVPASEPTEVRPLTPPKSRQWRARIRNLAWVRALLLALPAAWLLVFGMPITAAIALVPSVVMLAGGRAWAAALSIAVSLLVAAMTRMPVTEYSARVTTLVAKQKSGGPESFSTRDLAGIWGLNVVVGAGGFACWLPEVAQETLLLAWPFAPDVVRFDGDVAMRSPKVRAAIDAMMDEAEASGADRIELGPKKIVWERYDVSDSPRAGLALNALDLRASGRKLGGEWRLDLSGRVQVRYPPAGTLAVGPFEIHEGLFWVAQERGWLHPYEADWRWTVGEDDPRLREAAPDVSWLEKKLFPRGR